MRNAARFNLWLLFVFLVVSLFSATKECVAATSSTKPQPGEIRIDGEILAINNKTKVWTVIAKSFALPSGKQVAISPPKLKKINVTEQAALFSASAPAAAVAATDVFEWMRVSIVGANAGSGKPLNAKTIFVDTNSGDVPWFANLKQPSKTGETKTSPLLEAAMFGSNDEIERALDEGAQVDERDEGGKTPLFMAASLGRLEAVRLLIQRGANPNAYDATGDTPLTFCAVFDEPVVVDFLIKRGADVNAVSRQGITALMMATSMNKIATARILLKAGADPNKRTRRHKSPLTVAQLAGYDELAKLLLDHGATRDPSESD